MKLILILLFSINIYAFEQPNVQNLNWNGLDVAYLEDNQTPTYDIIMYFADGALSDKTQKGVSKWMFSNLDIGTNRYSRNEINDSLEFYGASWGPYVSHEYTTYHLSGLYKDIKPTLKKICHLFNDATFPNKELVKQKRLTKNSLQNIVNSPAAIIQKAFREISLAQTPYRYPVNGKLKDFKRITRQKLLRKLKYFNKEVYKKIYIRSPKGIKSIASIFNEDCHWNGSSKYKRNKVFQKSKFKHKITLVTVPKANQARVMIGRYLNFPANRNGALDNLSTQILGDGGFSSMLMQKLRVEHGLTYGASSSIGYQKNYGRVIISTFTKNENIIKLLNLLNKVIDDAKKGNFSKDYLENSKNALIGSFPFKFENKNRYLQQLLFLDHQGESYDYLTTYQDKVSKFNSSDVTNKLKFILDSNKIETVILGPKSLYKVLKKEFGKVSVIDYKRFL